MTVTWWLLKGDARIYLWYLVGIAVGGVISLYHFQPGTVYSLAYRSGRQAVDVMVDKMRYPYYTRLILYGGILPLCLLWRKTPQWLVILATVGSGVYLLFHGGARSLFGVYIAAAMSGFGACYFQKTAIRLAKHTILLVGMAGLGAMLLYGLYAHWAKSGALGEGELNKFEQEEETAMESGDSRLATRGKLGKTLEVIKEKPWGEGGTNLRHSVISNSLNCEGFVGLAFWIYFLLCVLWFCKNRLAYSQRFSVFLMLAAIGTVWNVLGSPFGARHNYFALMAFISLCRDNPGYGAGTVFEDRTLKGSRRPVMNFR